MHLDVIDLMAFYRTPLGLIARAQLRRKVRGMWPNVRGDSVLGLGFATPLLRPFRDEAARVMALMPAAQGVCHWPPEGRNCTALAEETRLPLHDASVERVLLLHAVETADQAPALLSEVWRVLTAGGEAIVIVPNRRGLWARAETTPFGYGRPFSRGQLDRLLRDAQLAVEAWETVLHVPPTRLRVVLRAAGAWEGTGHRLWPAFGGLHVVRLTKQVYARRPRGTPATARRPLIAIPGLAAPQPVPAPRSAPREQEDGLFAREVHEPPR